MYKKLYIPLLFGIFLFISVSASAQIPNEVEQMLNNLDENGFPKKDDFLSLEDMMKDVSNVTDTAGIKDTLIRFNPVINENVNIKNFKLEGIWQLVYKEYTNHDIHITPYNDPTEQKKCLNGKLIFGNGFVYGNTTCLSNLAFYAPKDLKRNHFSIQKAINNDDISPKMRYLYTALQERYDVKNLNTIEFTGEAFESNEDYMYFILNDSTLLTFFDGYVFFLKKVEQINSSLSLEEATRLIRWEEDSRGFKMIVGKNTGTVYDFLDTTDMISKDPKAKIHFVYYPPKLGQNYLTIHNLYINQKTGQMVQKLFYSNRETLNNIKHIYINPKALLSNFLRITLDNSMNKKYSWGIKYKLEERNIQQRPKKGPKKEKTEEQTSQ